MDSRHKTDGLNAFSLEELKEELRTLEEGSFIRLTDDELFLKIRRIHIGFMIHAPVYSAGTFIFRAVRVAERPSHKSRVSYPPREIVLANGRLNSAGEVMFYGALNQFASCLFECGMRAGELFAVSAWETTSKMIMNHLGYSQAVLEQVKARRELPNFVVNYSDDERNSLIAGWQSRVFTASVPPDKTHLYRLPIALKKFALAPMATAYPNSPSAFSGIVYPSVAMWLLADNIALLAPEVDSKMRLIEVMLLTLESTTVVPTNDGGQQTSYGLRLHDTAKLGEEDCLVWGHVSRFVNSFDSTKRRSEMVIPGITGRLQWQRE